MRVIYFASLTSFCVALHAAQISSPQSELRTELLRTMPRCDEVAENAARLILSGGPTDAVLAEWKSICPQNMQVVLFELARKISSIDATTPELTSELWLYLKSTGRERRSPTNHSGFHKLLKLTAENQMPGSNDGSALKDYIVSGYGSFYSSVARAKSGRLWEFFQAEQKDDRFFMSMALTAGAWVPTGNLARLGNHPAIGFQFMGGYGRFSAGFLMDFRFVNTPSEYAYYDPNTQNIRRTSTFFGLFFGPDLRWEILRDEQFSVFLLASFGYDVISHYAAPRYSGKASAYSDSFNMNGGLAFRYYFSEERTVYTDLEIRYHRARYSSGATGGDDLDGNYFTANAAIGYRLPFH